MYTPGRTVLRNPYPHWHKICENHTLSGILIENPTLCGTEIGQNGTLAVLAYAHFRQWECPPRVLSPHKCCHVTAHLECLAINQGFPLYFATCFHK